MDAIVGSVGNQSWTIGLGWGAKAKNPW